MLARILAFTLSFAAPLAAQSPSLRLFDDGDVDRQAPPAHADCWSSPNVYFFAVRGRAAGLAGHQLVTVVRPVLWDDSSPGWFVQCIEPRPDRHGRFIALAQVGSHTVPGGAWFGGQRAEVAVLAVPRGARPPLGIAYPSLAAVPGAAVASAARAVRLTAANCYRVVPPCDAAHAAMQPFGKPTLGARDFGLRLTSTLEGGLVTLLLGEPTYVGLPLPSQLPASACWLQLGPTPVFGPTATIAHGEATFVVPIPRSSSLRGLRLALQAVAQDPRSGEPWTSGAWLVTPW